MSLNAYQAASVRSESPRELEYRLFGQVTRALIEASAAEATELQKRAAALAWNRNVWEALANDCAESGNQLPDQLRASIISLAIFVRKHSRAVIREGADFDILIEINRSIMEGLKPRAAAESAPA